MSDPIQHLGPAATLPSGDPNPLSHVVVVGDLVFLSGLMPKDETGALVDGDITEQTHCVMKRMASMLDLAGCGFRDVVKVTAWLTHAEDFTAFNRAYASYFEPPFPARSAVRCDLLLPKARLEIEAIARVPIA